MKNPDAQGPYRCPHKCGTAGYPAPKWKTEAGYLGHLAKCPKRPEAAAEQQQRQHEQLALRAQEACAALAAAQHKIGDLVHYVERRVIRGTHEQRHGRSVRVRYDEELRHSARTTEINAVGYDYAGRRVVYNAAFSDSDVQPTHDAAQARAAELQAAHEESVRFARMCR